MGKATQQPVYKLLGGRCQDKLRAYANVIRLLPPLIIEEDLLRDGLGVLD